jgi:enoyl-CoA hydratase/carnithine racemase
MKSTQDRIVPEACSTWYVPRLVGPSAAIDLVLSADIFDAEAALTVGLVDEVHPDDDLLTQAVRVPDSWTRSRSPVAVALTDQIVRRNGSLAHPRMLTGSTRSPCSGPASAMARKAWRPS